MTVIPPRGGYKREKKKTYELITLIFAGLGVVQIPFTAYDTSMKAWENTEPDLHMSVPDAKPFTSPISITNNSSFITMHNVKLDCDLADKHKDHSGTSASFGSEQRGADIPPGKTIHVECFDRSEIKEYLSASVFPHVTYNILGFDRSYDNKFFIWYDIGKEPRWIESYRQ